MSLSEETKEAIKRHRDEHGSSHREALRFVMAEREAATWNDKHPVGTPVIVTPYTDCHPDVLIETKTRSVAYVISGHASVMVEGKSGGYGLSFVKVAS